MKNDKERTILLNFLKSGMSTRELDRVLGHSPKKTRGWKSWSVLKKYGLKNEEKGKLFLYSERESKKIINEIIRKNANVNLSDLIKNMGPESLEKYKNTFVTAENEKTFYEIFSGETRNIIQRFFNPKKKFISRCQFEGCKNKKDQIDTVHYSHERPEIFIKCAKTNGKKQGDMIVFDVYKTMRCFLKSHSKRKIVCFLCKKHHLQFHRLQKNDRKEFLKFKNKINII